MSISDFDDASEGDDVPDTSDVLTLRIDDRHAGERLDKALAQLIPEVSRSRLQQWVVAGAVSVNGHTVKARHTLTFDDVVEVKPQPAPDAAAYTPESMALDVAFEDDAILVLNKPPKLVVHPAAGHWSGTLLNGLLAYVPALSEVPRAGIVHRLDADTSGLMVVAKTLAAQTDLVRQLQARTVTRDYWALVLGVPAPRGVIDAAIGRDPRNPLRFKVSTTESAKPARTHYARIDSTRAAGAEISWLCLPAGDGSNSSNPRSSRAYWPSVNWRSAVSAQTAAARRARGGLESVRSAGAARVPAKSRSSGQPTAPHLVSEPCTGPRATDA